MIMVQIYTNSGKGKNVDLVTTNRKEQLGMCRQKRKKHRNTLLGSYHPVIKYDFPAINLHS